MATPRSPRDEVLAALDDVVVVLRETTSRNQAAIRRAQLLRRQREKGLPYREIVPKEKRPLVVELLSTTLAELSDASARLRKAEARALYDEGLTMERIATLFGVTRQRVAALRAPDGR